MTLSRVNRVHVMSRSAGRCYSTVTVTITLSLSLTRLDHRETWNLTVVDPVSGNYYPVTSRIYIQVWHVAKENY